MGWKISDQYPVTLGYDDFSLMASTTHGRLLKLVSTKFDTQVLNQTVLVFADISQQCWHRLPKSILSISHILDKSTVVRFKHRFHGPKANVLTAKKRACSLVGRFYKIKQNVLIVNIFM